MSIRDRIARFLNPDLMDPVQVQTLVEEEVKQARMSAPINANYDPQGEGYRRLGSEQNQRDLSSLSQDQMLEIAYWMLDSSGMTQRFAKDTRNFVLGEGVTYEVENDPDGLAKDILDAFWNDSINLMDIRLPNRILHLGALGEQCWPVSVNPINGFVRLSYIDPTDIDAVQMVPGYPEVHARVDMKPTAGRNKGRSLPVVREELDPRKPEYGRLVGECFFFAVNHPPNSSRGRSDLRASFDFINSLEDSLFNELDRAQHLKAHVWDVELNGADEDAIREFLRDNPTPKPGSVRAHNEQVKWQALSPSLNAGDNKAFFEMIRTYLSGCNNRPDSWFGSGGKAYQNEADLMGEPTFKDLGERQRYVKYIVEYVLKFVLDQAILHGTIHEPKDGFKVTANLPEPSTKDTIKIGNGLTAIANGLGMAEDRDWITPMDAASLFVSVVSRVGVEITVNEALEEIAKAKAEGVTDDYLNNPRPQGEGQTDKDKGQKAKGEQQEASSK